MSELAAPAPTAASPADPRLRAFARLLAVGVLGHAFLWLTMQMLTREGILLYPDRWAWTPGLFFPTYVHLGLNWVVFLAVALYMTAGARPFLAARLLFALAVFHFLGLPERVPNHFLVLVVALGILAFTPARSLAAGGRLPLALVRLLGVLTYFYAFLHKLNAGYFDIERSPVWVVDTVLRSTGLYGRLHGDPAFFRVAVAASLLAEIGLPLLLLWRRTRLLALLGGLAFHGVIAMADAPDYTAVILAFYAAFLEPDEARAIASRLRRRRGRKLGAALAIAALALRASYVFSLEELQDPANGTSRLIQGMGLFVLLAAIAYVFLAVAPLAVERRPQAPPGDVPLPRPWSRRQIAVLAAVALLYSLNCLSPYLGLKYYFSQAMFSALSLDGSNHYLLPHAGIRDDPGRFVRLEQLRFDRPAAARLSPRSVPLFDLLLLRGDWVEGNFLRSVLWHACREGGLAPIEVRYRTAGATVDMADACVSRLGHHPFNLYPYAPRRHPFGD